MANKVNHYTLGKYYYFQGITAEQAARRCGVSAHFLALLFTELDKMYPEVKARREIPEKPIASRPHRG